MEKIDKPIAFRLVLPRNCGPQYHQYGHKHARRENFSKESNARRLAGLRKTWRVQRKKVKEGKMVHKGSIKYKQRQAHLQLKRTVAKEFHDIQRLCREFAEAGVKRLGDMVINSPNEMAVIAATNALHDRGYGKSSQTNVNVNTNLDGKPKELTQQQLQQRIEAALKRAEEITGGEPKPRPRKREPADIRKLH